MQLSFEFFPPKTDKGRANLARTAETLMPHGGEFVSVTYGAGGSTRDGTEKAVTTLSGEGLDVAPHLSIGGDDTETVVELVSRYRDAGIRRIVALRGDLPSGYGRTRNSNNAEALVRLLRGEFGDHFHIEVAAYPEVHPDATSPDMDMEFFKRKVDAGANAAITQYFYHPNAYEDFVNRAVKAGVTCPIVPGVMPITNYDSLARFSKGCGAEIPAWIEKQLIMMKDDDAALREFGVEVVTRLCEQLLAAGAPGLHFYTLNKASPTTRICANLGFGAAA